MKEKRKHNLITEIYALAQLIMIAWLIGVPINLQTQASWIVFLIFVFVLPFIITRAIIWWYHYEGR